MTCDWCKMDFKMIVKQDTYRLCYTDYKAKRYMDLDDGFTKKDFE